MTLWTVTLFLVVSTWFIPGGVGEALKVPLRKRSDPSHNAEQMRAVNYLISLFGDPIYDDPIGRESRVLENEGGAYGETMECYCEVVVNGGHNVRGEEAICGPNNFRRRILCPHYGGCQTARANVQGFVSAVRTCGFDTRQFGCHFHKEKAELVGTVDVERCFCKGNLCNHGPRLGVCGHGGMTFTPFLFVLGGIFMKNFV